MVFFEGAGYKDLSLGFRVQGLGPRLEDGGLSMVQVLRKV